jgi:hypothetical protein
MKKFILLVIATFTVSLMGCTPKNINTTDFSTKADRVTYIGGQMIKQFGPIITAATCISMPQYCIPAKAAYKASVVIIDAIEEAKKAGDGAKVATLALELVQHLDEINGILATTGQKKIDLTELQTTVKELNTP